MPNEAVATAGQTIAIGGSDDVSVQVEKLSEKQWERLSDQRDKMIDAMIRVFTLLNGGVYLLVVAAWVGGLVTAYRIVDSQTLMALIGATVVQAGIAFIAITRFLFPTAKPD